MTVSEEGMWPDSGCLLKMESLDRLDGENK